jgi:uncharacterized protein involved in response to NO
LRRGARRDPASRNRNWFFIVFVLALGLASVAFQAWPQAALAVGLDVVLLVIAIMGGRVIPSFTNSAVMGAGARRNRWVEYGALGSVLLLIVFDSLQAPAWPVALAAALLHAIRVALWRRFDARGRSSGSCTFPTPGWSCTSSCAASRTSISFPPASPRTRSP